MAGVSICCPWRARSQDAAIAPFHPLTHPTPGPMILVEREVVAGG